MHQPSTSLDLRTHILEWRGAELVSTHEAAARVALAEREAGGETGLSIRLLPDIRMGAKTAGYVSVSVAPLRVAPRQAAEQSSQVLLGDYCQVLEPAGPDFYRVRVHGPARGPGGQPLAMHQPSLAAEDDQDDSYLGYLGYLHREHIHLVQPCWRSGYEEGALQMVATLYAQALAAPDPATEPVFDVSRGGWLRTWPAEASPPDAGTWLRVATPDMRLGYLPADALLSANQPRLDATTLPASLCQEARRYMGVPYVWGGTSPRGLDCSGLVWLSARMLGLRLLRDASQQATQGSPVLPDRDVAALAAGDLLFFGPEPGRITHVAIYLGEGRYIHASGRVRINSLLLTEADFQPHRYETWQWSRRVIRG